MARYFLNRPHISKWFLSPVLAGSWRGLFPHLLWEPGQAPGSTSHCIVGGGEELWLDLSGIFISYACPHRASSIHQLQLRVSFVGTGSHNSFCSWLFQETSPSYIYNSGLSCAFLSLTDIRRFCEFFIVFSCLLVRTSGASNLYMRRHVKLCDT